MSRYEVPHRWWVVTRDDAGHVTGTGMRTAPFSPYPLFVLPMPEDAALALAGALHERGEKVGGVNGALPAAEVCAAEVARRQGGSPAVQMHTQVHRLETVVPPRAAAGRLRAARRDEAGLALEWYAAFVRDADEQAGREPGSIHEMGETRRAWRAASASSRSGSGSTPTTVPCTSPVYNPPAFGAARVGPVYTPCEHRGRGYAANAVALLSQRILDDGTCPASTPTRRTRPPTGSTPHSGTGRSSTW